MEDNKVKASDSSIAAGGDIKDNIINIGFASEIIFEHLTKIIEEKGELKTLLEIEKEKVSQLGSALNITEQAAFSFLKNIDEKDTSKSRIEYQVRQVAERNRDLANSLSSLDFGIPKVSLLRNQINKAITSGSYDEADELIEQAREIEFRRIGMSPRISGYLSNGWHELPHYLWRRFFARYVDFFVAGLVFIIGLEIIDPAAAERFLFDGSIQEQNVRFSLTGLLITLIFNSIITGYAGISVGKWIYGIRIQGEKTESGLLGFRKSLYREWLILFRGLGLGIAFILVICAIYSAFRLKRKYQTSWDEKVDAIVLYKEFSNLRSWSLIALGIGLLALNILAFISELSVQ